MVKLAPNSSSDLILRTEKRKAILGWKVFTKNILDWENKKTDVNAPMLVKLSPQKTSTLYHLRLQE